MIVSRSVWMFCGWTCLAVCSAVPSRAEENDSSLPPVSQKTVDFEQQIFPLLKSKCFDCHGTDAQESELRLDRKASLLRGGNSGEPAIVVGKSAESHLIKLVAGLDPKIVMPPDQDGRLTPEQIGLLRGWIDQGANWPGPNGIVTTEKLTSDHWSFQPVQEVDVPQFDDPWLANSIDAFVLRKLREKQIPHNPSTNRRTLIRRVFLDMLGIPPTPAEVNAFVDDKHPDAYERLIESVLTRPQYGERWARYWLDLVRFAETYGFETNRERPHAWPYRDYVIESLNNDKSYDQFIREQIAGDVYGTPIGTGYLVAGPYDQVKSPDINLTLMQRQNELDDILGTTSTVFLGLTVGCARCHNHKFDPILQTDYYSLQAIFAGVKHGDRALPLSTETKEKLKEVEQQLATLKTQLAKYRQTAHPGKFLLIDDDPKYEPDRIEVLQPIAGHGTNPEGTGQGHKSDPGDETRSPNVSRGQYTWWKPRPGEPVIAYRPRASGRFRVWLSWGCGYETHTTDARYVLDRDGDPSTQNDWTDIASIDQQRFAGAKSSSEKLPQQALWSGFHNAGEHEFGNDDTILLVAGETGTAITADAILFEELAQPSVTEAPRKPSIRESVNASHNVEHLTPVDAKYVRFTIHETNSSQPCLDELEIFAGETNVALASTGAKPTASSSLPGYEIHKLAHINDGQYGNSHSWISNDPGAGWVQIELPQVSRIDRIEWARDREGNYGDRLATSYEIEISTNGESWQTVSSSLDRLPPSGPKATAITYRFDHLPAEEAQAGRDLLTQLQNAESERTRLSQRAMVYAGQFDQPGPTHRLYRGEPQAPREQVLPNVPALFDDLKLPAETPEQQRRQALADWIASPDNPLTARVIVNRIWQYHFGTGLVATPSDFGSGGVPPTHPELLDWLARELITHNWSLKHIHRVILTSSTYRQSSRPNPTALAIDGATQYWWRFPPRRLAAEPIRDSILAVSGVLDLKMGGPGFSAFEVEAENVRHYHPKKSYGPEDWRRMIYMTKVRMEQDSVFGLFDCPDAATSVPNRSRSTTPLQALNLFNSAFLLQQAELFAKRLESEHPENIPAQVAFAYELCYSREPTESELNDAMEFIQSTSLTAFCRALLNSNELLFLQ